MATWTLPGSCTISPLMFRTHPAHIGSVGGLHRARRERDTHAHTPCAVRAIVLAA